jgi:hypothetical protein
MRPSISSKGTKAMKMKGAIPHVGQAAVSNPPLKIAPIILRVRDPLAVVEPVETPLLFLYLFMMFPKIRAKVRFFVRNAHHVAFFLQNNPLYQKNNYFCTNFPENEESI